mmetsp:Transcript_31658/g.37724  ORF Transcript_31658/g.37724 Transcript_31658/m.37724 type:complete len:82 (-) Transcript_31658:152-397(-)
MSGREYLWTELKKLQNKVLDQYADFNFDVLPIILRTPKLSDDFHHPSKDPNVFETRLSICQQARDNRTSYDIRHRAFNNTA